MEEADRKRREEFKSYEMEKKFEQHERLNHIDDEEKRNGASTRRWSTNGDEELNEESIAVLQYIAALCFETRRDQLYKTSSNEFRPRAHAKREHETNTKQSIT